jgi:hypothetical protein
LQDTSGRLIDGDQDGQPGGNALGLLGRGGATIHAVLYQGMSTVPSFEPSAVDVLLEREDLAGLLKPLGRNRHGRRYSGLRWLGARPQLILTRRASEGDAPEPSLARG